MEQISVIGSGTMGNGIAHVFGLNGYKVQLYDLSAPALEEAMQAIATNLDRQIRKEIISEADKKETLNNLNTNTNLQDAIKDSALIIEAVYEDVLVKKSIFQEADKYAPKEAILASNTSSISISLLASFTGRSSQVIGMHFMNPVPVMELVEVIRGYNTSSSTAEKVISICEKINKIPVEVHDYPGFISNRILMPMINEAIYALFEGVSGVVEIDTIMKLGMAHPMGPLHLADYIGLDVCLSILKVMHDGLGNPKYAPCPLIVNMVQAGHLGRKTGQGFYLWEKGSKELKVAPRFQR